jgi:hypothetical protein
MTKRPDVTAALLALQPLPDTVRLVSIDPTKNRQRLKPRHDLPALPHFW